MVKIIQESNSENELLRSILRHIKTTLKDRYFLLQSSNDFSFLDNSKISLVKESTEVKIYITKVLENREQDFNEFQMYLKFAPIDSKKEDLRFLLLVETENYQQIKKASENYKNKMSQPKPKEETVVTFMAKKPRYSLEQIIISEEEKDDIVSTLTLINERELIYDKWGFSEIDSKPRLILNFYGAPGTGKTMSAHAVANELNKNILLINYSEIESKYVGDAPKNLMKAFEEAKKSDAVLFFDEADSFLGKRVENVTSSSDQSVNSLRSQMLILLEEFEGVVIFATNLMKNYDPAFESRILKSLEFRLPSKENRIKMIDRMLVKKIPFSEDFNREENLDKLADITEGFSGRELKNSVLESLLLAVHNRVNPLTKEILISGFEKSKQRKESVERSKNTISPEIKEKLEQKIKTQLTKEKEDKVLNGKRDE